MSQYSHPSLPDVKAEDLITIHVSLPQVSFANTANYYLSATSALRQFETEFEMSEYENFPSDKGLEEMPSSFDEDGKEIYYCCYWPSLS